MKSSRLSEIAADPAVACAGRPLWRRACVAFWAAARSSQRPGRRTGLCRIVALGVWIAASGLPVVAEAHGGDGVFTLAKGQWLEDEYSFPRDIAMLRDGSVVGVVESGGWRLTP